VNATLSTPLVGIWWNFTSMLGLKPSSAWSCMKARFLCNMFHSKVIALLSRLPVGAFATLCVFHLKLEKTFLKAPKSYRICVFLSRVRLRYSKHIFFICMPNHGELGGLNYENNVIVRWNQHNKQLHGFDVWWCNPSVR